MNNNEIIDILNKSIHLLYKYDECLLEDDLSERSICHKLAEHLQSLIKDYDVDCEYNKNIANPGGRKKIYILKEELASIRKLTAQQQNMEDDEFIELSVYPDIIVHKRRNSDENKLIVEVKKSTNTDKEALKFDLLKMQTYTSHEDGDELNYQLGAFITFPTGRTNAQLTIEYYLDGNKVNLEELI